MTWSDWLNGLKIGSNAPRRKIVRRKQSRGILSRQNRPAALSTESLEDRALLAANLSLLAGTLQFTGNAADVNNLTVSVTGNTYTFMTSGGDNITVTSDDSGTATGTGTNVVTIGAADLNITNLQIDLGDGADSIVLSSLADPVTVTGGAGVDTLTSGNTDSIFSIGATLVVNTSGQNATFSSFDTVSGGTGKDQFSVTAANSLSLAGGAGDDKFTVASGVTLTGSIDGTSGSDSLTLATANSTVVLTASDANGVTAGAGGVTGVSGGFSHIDTLNTTGGGVETLTGRTATNAWDVDAGTVNDGTATLTYTGVDSLVGGGGADTFSLSANATASIAGGAGDDTLSIAANILLTGSFDGTSGTNDNVSVATDATLATLTSGAAGGFSGTITGVTGTFANVDSITTTGATTESIVGPDATNTWDVDANTIASGGGTLTYSGFDSLFGGTGNDAFSLSAAVTRSINAGSGNDSLTITTGGVLTGSFDGSFGSDTLDLQTAAAAVVLTQSNSTGFGGTATGITGNFLGVNTLTVTGGTGDSLTGQNATALWDVDAGTVSVNSNTLTYTGFGSSDTLTGGTENDTFGVSVAVVATLTINGGAGDDTFDIDASFAGSLNGTTGVDTLDISGVAAANATIGVLGANGAAVTAITTVTGGATNIDVISGGASATLTGGTATPTWTVGAIRSFSDGTNSVSYSGFSTLQGGTADDTFNLTGPTSYVLNGGDGNDSFVFATGGSTTGTIVGGNGAADTLNYSAIGTAISVNFATGAATSVFNGAAAGVSTVENAVGSSTGDTLVGDASANSLTGGGGNDTITGNDGADTLTGSAGTDTLLQAISGAATLTPTTLVVGTTDTIATFEVVTINGADGTNETLTIDLAAGSGLDFEVNFNGGVGGNDALALQNGTVTSSVYNFTNATDGSVVLGAAGTTTINYTGLDPITSTLGTTSATLNYSTVSETIGLTGSATITATSTAGESVALTAPTGTLTVNAGDVGDDSVTVGITGGPTALVVNTGTGNDTITFTGISVGTTVDGGVGTNTIVGDGAGRTYTATGANAGTINTVAPIVTYSNIQNVTAGAGNDTFDFTNGSMQGSIDSGTGTDTLIGNAGYNNVFTVTGAGSGTASVLTGTFAGIENITGGPAADHLILNGGTITGTYTGGLGSDSITADNVATAFVVTALNAGTVNGTFAFAGVENLNGNAQADTFTLAGGTLDGTITGGAGSDTFTGNNTATTFSVIAPDTGLAALTAGGSQVAFWTQIENLTGGSGNDLFLFTDDIGDSVSGNIVGGAGTDTLQGANVENAWAITGANTGTVTRVGGTFSAIEGLVGGTQGDTFTFTAAAGAVSSIDGNGIIGTDTIVFAPGVNTTVNVTALDAGTSTTGTATFSNIKNLTGNNGDDTFIIASGASLSGSINGSTGNDLLNRDSLAAASIAWTVTSAGGGTVSGVAGTFGGIESVTGGAGTDSFSFSETGSLAGALNGGAGTADTLSYLPRSSNVTVNLSTNSASSITGTVTGIENITGGNGDDALTGDANVNVISGGSGNDTITGNAGADALDGGFGTDRLQETIAGGSTATLSGSTYSTSVGPSTDTHTSFESASILGGAGTDEALTLAFGTETHLGTIATIAFAAGGAAGTDSLNFTGSALFSSSTFTHTNATDGTIALNSTAINFFDVENGNVGVTAQSFTVNFTTATETISVAQSTTQNVITSSQAADFTINNPLNSLTLNTGDTGDDNLTLNGFGTGFGAALAINTGSGNDTVTLNALPTTLTSSVSIDGGAGTDSLVGGATALAITITGANSGTILVAGVTTSFSSFENLTSSSAADSFTINSPTSLVLDGGAGNDTLQGTLIDDVTLNAAVANGYSGTEASTGGFSGIDTIIATGGAGAITGTNNVSTWNIGATSTLVTGGITLTFSGFTTLNGGSAADTLTVDFTSANVIPSGLTYDGNGGVDTLNLTAVSNQFASQTFNYTNATDGSVVFTTAGNVNTTLNYLDLNPIVNTGTPLNVTFNLPAGADNATLSNLGGSARLAGGTFEQTDFTYPAAGGSITINMGAGAVADTLNIQDLNLNANTSLTVDGGDGADVINVGTGADINITGNLSLTAETIGDANDLIVTGTTTLNAGAGGAIALDSAANNFTGAVTITNTGSATLVDANALDLGNVTATGNVAVTVGGNLTDSGLLNITGTTTITAGGSDVILNNANNFGGAVQIVSAGNATLNDTGAITFSGTASAITTNLTVTAAGAITQLAGGSISAGGVTSLTAGAANNITLTESGNNFNSLTIVSGNDVSIRDSGAIDLGTSTVSGNFSLQAANTVTDSGVLTITGTTLLTVTVGNTTLDNANNFIGSVTVSAAGLDVTLIDTGSIDFAAVTVANLVVTAGGPITDSGTLLVTGTANLSATPTADAGNDITLNSAANNFGGDLTLLGNDVTIVDVNAVSIATATTGASLTVSAGDAISTTGLIDVSGSLSLTTTAGGITSTGQVLVDGASSLTAVGQAIAMNVATNDFLGVVTVSAGSLNIDDDTGLAFGVLTVTGNVDVDAGGLVDFGGAATITGGTLDVDADANGGPGSITDSVGPVSVTGNATLDGGTGSITLDNPANNFQANVVVVNASNVTIDDANGINFNGIAATGNVDIDAAGAINFDNATTVGGTLDADSNANGGTGGAINDGATATFAVTGAATFDAGDQDLTIDGNGAAALGAGTNFGSITFTGKDVLFVEDSSTIILGPSSATGVGADFVLASAAQISINGTVNSTNNVTVTSGTVGVGTIALNAKMTAGGTVTFTSVHNITIGADIDPTTVTLSATNDISIAAAVAATTQITVTAGTDGTGSVNLQLGGSLTTTVAGGDINISSGNNAGTGGSITFTGNVTSLDDLTITSTGTVTQPGGKLSAADLILVSGTGMGGDFTLGSATNDFDTIAFNLSGTGKASVTEADGVSVSGTSQGGALSVASTGIITVGAALTTGAAAGGGIAISGGVTVNGTVTVGAGKITLAGSTAATSDVDINSAITADGADITISAPRDVLVGATVATTTSGNITISGDSDLTGTGGVEVEAAGLVDALGTVTLSGSDVNATAGPIDAVVIDSNGPTVQVEANGNVIIQDGTGAPATSTTVINGLVQRGGGAVGSILIRAKDDVIFGADGDVVQNNAAGTTTTITADNGGAASSGGVTMNAGTVINGDNGTITISADDDVTLTGLATNDATAAAVTITVANGEVIDAGDTTTDISAAGAGATVNITAKDGVGVANAIETNADMLVVSTTNANIQIVETNGLNALSLNAGTGNVTLTVGGLVTDADASDDIVGTTATITSTAGDFGTNANKIDTNVTNLNASSSAAGNIFIDETSGLSSLNVSTTGNVTLTAAGSITDADGAQDIAGNVVSVTLSTGDFGASGSNINTAATNLSVNTSAGNGTIWATEADGLTELGLNAGTGNVNLTVTANGVASADGAFDDVVGTNATIVLQGAGGAFGAAGNAIGTAVASLSVSTNNGDQFITESNGLTAVNLSSGTADISLTAAGSIIDSDGTVDVSGDAFAVTAGGAITLGTTVNSTTVSTTAAGSVSLTETDAITVTTATVNNGSFSLTAGGAITATAITSTTDSDANDISLTTTAGNIQLGNVNAGATGDATITAAAAITDDGDAAATDLTADDVVLVAAGSIGSVNFETAIANLEGSATGAVTFDNTLAAGLTFGGASGSFSGFTAGGAVTITDATGTMTFSEALSASGQTVLLTANDMVSNGDGDSSSVDIVAASLGLTSSNGIGDLADSVEINATTLAFVNGPNGDVRIRDIAGGLTVGDVGAITSSSSSGMAQIVALSPLTVAHAITATTGLVLTATDSSGSGDDLTINASVTGSVITLNGGDNITQAAGTTINATATAININADAGTADANGSVVTINGTLQSNAASTITGGSEADSISLTATAVISTTGGLTINGAGGSDTATINLNGTLNATVSVNDLGSSSADTDRVIVIGSGTAYDLNNSTPNDGSPQTGGVVISGGETVSYNQNVESVEVRGTAGADTFDVEPSQTARITIDGLGNTDTLDVETFGGSFGIAGNTIVVNGGNPNAFLPISFRNIENITGNGVALAPGAATQKFDFIDYDDTANTFSPTAAGFLPVQFDRVFSVQYPRTGTGIVSTYGWRAGNTADLSTYPVISDIDDGPLAGTTFSDLLRDGHTANSASTFTTQIGNGFYQITLQVFDVTNFRVRNADTGIVLTSGRSISGHGVISFVTNVTDGSLDLTFDQVFPGNPDSEPDAQFRIDGLELQPATSATFLGLSASTLSAQPLAADGVTVDAFTIAGTAGLVTVSASLDTNGDGKGDVPLTVTTADTDSVLNLTQVNAGGGFSIRRPTAAGTGIITLQLPDGGFGVSTVEYAATATGLLYDFNLNSSPTETGYVGVEPTNLNIPSSGYGWTTEPGAYNTASFPVTTRVDFLRDGATGNSANTFSTQLTNGTYTVNVTIGSPSGALANVAVKAEGNTAATGVSTPIGQFATRQFLVTVADGQLDLEFSSGSATGWAVAGIEVRNAVTAVNFTTALGTVAPDGTTIDVINGNAPANTLITVNSTLGTITSVDQSPLYDGIQVLSTGGGTFSFTLQRPVVLGTPTITAVTVNGNGQASSTAVVSYGSQTLRSFDFGTDSSPVAAGFTAVPTGSVFSATLGYGWFGPDGSPSTYNRGLATGTTNTALFQDGAFIQNKVFRIAAAAGNYDLRLYYGDQYSPAGGTITAEGAAPVAAPTLGAASFSNVEVQDADDANGDGYIDIVLTVNSTALALFANGLEVATNGNLPAAQTLTAESVGDGAAAISAGDLTAIVSAAINRYSDLGLSGSALSRLQSIQFSVADLGGATIGLSGNGVVVIDDDAAGNGWYVDATPADDSEFSGAGSELRASSGAAAGKYDLLTAVMHELGHELGLDDISPAVDGDDLMTGVIGSGVRRLADVDAVFAANQFWGE